MSHRAKRDEHQRKRATPMTSNERLLKQNIDRLHRATKDLTKVFQDHSQATSNVIESMMKVMSEMTSTSRK